MAPYPNDLCCKMERCSDAEVVPRFLETRSVNEERVVQERIDLAPSVVSAPSFLFDQDAA